MVRLDKNLLTNMYKTLKINLENSL